MKVYPLKFLDYYNKEDKDYFFGRKEETELLYKMVFQSDLTLVYGESGTGKSSLVHCGLASKFNEYEWLPLKIFRGSDIINSLLSELTKQMPINGIEIFPKGKDIENKTSQILKIIHKQLFRPLYLIFDQLEELFILGNTSEQKKYFAIIKNILENESNTKIILIIREEYIGKLSEFEKVIPNILRKRLRVERMDQEKVARVIDGIDNLENSLIKFEGINNTTDTNVPSLKMESSISVTAREVTNRIFNVINKENGQLFVELPYLQVYLDYIYDLKTTDDNHLKEAIFKLSDFESNTNFANVLKLFLDKQVIKLGNKHKIETELIWDALKELVSIEGTKSPISLEDFSQKLIKLLKTEISKISELVSDLDTFRITKTNEQTKLKELNHDLLAKLINEKRTPDELKKLEIEQMIENVVNASVGGKIEYFSKSQLRLINEHKNLSISEIERKWIRESKIHSKWIFFKNYILPFLFIIIFVVSLLKYYTSTALEAKQLAIDTMEQSFQEIETAKILQKEAEKEKQKADSAIINLLLTNKELERVTDIVGDNKKFIDQITEIRFSDSIYIVRLKEKIEADSVAIREFNRLLSTLNDSINNQKNAPLYLSNIDSIRKEINEKSEKTTIPIMDLEDVKWFKEGFFLLYGNIKISLNELNVKENKASFLVCEIFEANTLCIDSGASIIDLSAGKSRSISLGENIYKLTLIKIDNAGKNPLTKAAYITFSKTN